MALAIFLRTIAIYLIVLIVIRLMGKREVGELSAFDLVVAIMIAEIAVIPMEQLERPLLMALIPLFTLVGAEIFLAFLCLKSRLLRKIIDGSPSVIIFKGKIMEQEMRRTRYNLNDLLSQLREKNVVNIDDVEYAILETTGELSVILKSDRRPLTPRDIKMEVPPVALPVPLIFDGHIHSEGLKDLGADERWLREGLARIKGVKPEDVFFASYDPHHGFYLSLKEKKND